MVARNTFQSSRTTGRPLISSTGGFTANIRVKPYTDVLKFANVVYPENNSFITRNCFRCKRATPNVSTAHLQTSLTRSVRHIRNTHQLIYARRILRVSS